jgi:hypothetical protein
MTTTVFSVAPLLHSSPALVCQLRDITPHEAIARLASAGVLATEGLEPSSIVLLGYRYEIANLVRAYSRHADVERNNPRLLAKLRRLASAS